MRLDYVIKNVCTQAFINNATISACEKGGQWEKALELLREMSDRGIEPNVISYSAAISACEKGSQWEKALDLLREMSDRGIEPDVISYSAAISACEKGGQWEKALDLFQEMANCGIEPNVIFAISCKRPSAFSHCPTFSQALIAAL